MPYIRYLQILLLLQILSLHFEQIYASSKSVIPTWEFARVEEDINKHAGATTMAPGALVGTDNGAPVLRLISVLPGTPPPACTLEVVTCDGLSPYYLLELPMATLLRVAPEISDIAPPIMRITIAAPKRTVLSVTAVSLPTRKTGGQSTIPLPSGTSVVEVYAPLFREYWRISEARGASVNTEFPRLAIQTTCKDDNTIIASRETLIQFAPPMNIFLGRQGVLAIPYMVYAGGYIASSSIPLIEYSAGFVDAGWQPVQTRQELYTTKKGNCVESTLAIAGQYIAAGYHPVLALFPQKTGESHILFGMCPTTWQPSLRELIAMASGIGANLMPTYRKGWYWMESTELVRSGSPERAISAAEAYITQKSKEKQTVILLPLSEWLNVLGGDHNM